jgi:hypothetical protein
MAKATENTQSYMILTNSQSYTKALDLFFSRDGMRQTNRERGKKSMKCIDEQKQKK